MNWYECIDLLTGIRHGMARMLWSATAHDWNDRLRATGTRVLWLPVLALLLAVVPAKAQTTPPLQNVYAAGVSWNQSATPAVAGTALYAHAAGSSGTYVFTAIDVLPTSSKPFTVTTNIGAGIAQKLFSVGKIPVFVPTTAGVSWTGSNTGWQWTTGALVSIKLGKKTNWYAFPMVRVAKSNVSGSGYQPIIGLAFGWGQ